MTRTARPLVGRGPELRTIGEVTGAAAEGRGGAVLVFGEAGVGKSAILDAATESLEGWLVLRAGGVEFESELPHAALHQLLSPVLELRAGLPEPQRAALETVLGFRAPADGAAPPSPLLVGLATLALLSEAARDRPVCCVLDDVQWMDTASRHACGFAARRIAAERVAVLAAARTADAVPDLAAIRSLPVAGLGDADAVDLLRSVTLLGADAEVLARIIAEAQGNPLALTEFGRIASPWGLPAGRPGAGVTDALADRFVDRLHRLPDDARQLVELASAEPVGDLGLLRRAAGRLGLDPRRLAAAEEEGLVLAGPRLRFQHPLVRSAVYASVAAPAMRRLHAVLAECTDPRADPDRRAWHLSLSVSGDDEEVAAELVRSADRAAARGSRAAAATLLDRAARLTPSAGVRARRLLLAARASVGAGATAAARIQVDEVERGDPDPADRVEARQIRALVDFHVSRSPEATAALVGAAADLEPSMARETYLEAFASAMFVDRLPGRLRKLAEQVRKQAPPRQGRPQPADLLLDALLDQVTCPVEQAVLAMARAVGAYAAPDPTGCANPWWMELACLMAMDLRDAAAMDDISARQVETARRQGAFAVLPQALRYRALAATALGRFTHAAACLTEARAVDDAAGTISLSFADLILATWQGDTDRHAEITATLRNRIGRAEVVSELYASAVLHNGLGDYDTAFEVTLAAREQQDQGAYVVWHIDQELVEAAVRAGSPDAARPSLARLAALARGCPTPWAVATDLVARALVAGEREEAGECYREALDRLAETEVRVFHARTRLLYGEWLRRAGRRAESRVELRAAHETLSGAGARAFAARAARELRATGGQPRQAEAGPLDSLTAQERHIAGRVADGATSREVAVALFLSPRTVDTHLRNIYRKLGISSRRQLRGLPL